MELVIKIALALGADHLGDGEFKFTSYQDQQMALFIDIVNILPGFFPCEDWMLRSVLVADSLQGE